MGLGISHLLLGKDLRSIGNVNQVVELVSDQDSFDELFGLLFHHERMLVMRAADAIEKITRRNAAFLTSHKPQVLAMLHGAMNNELQWHIAQLIPRLPLNPRERTNAWNTLTYWALNRNESKIVRVNSLQALFDLSRRDASLNEPFMLVMNQLSKEKIPSIQARIKKLSNVV